MAYYADLLTEQFYHFELRGRGWYVAPYPVQIEPPFHPFFGHKIPHGYIDDGRRETWMSKATNLFRTTPTPTVRESTLLPYELFPAPPSEPLSVCTLRLVRGVSLKPERMEQILSILGECTHPVAFELIGSSEHITLQFLSQKSDHPFMYSQLCAYLPEYSIRSSEDMLEVFDAPLCIADLGLSEEFMRPISLYTGGERDSYIALCGVLEHMTKSTEQVVLQVLFTQTENHWSESIMRSVTLGGKASFFSNAPEMPALAQTKIASPLSGVCIRMMSQAPTIEAANSLLERAVRSLCIATASPHNSLCALPSEYAAEEHVSDFLLRRSRRFGMLLNMKELASLVHIPSSAVHSKKLYATAHTKAVHEAYRNETYVLGMNEHHGSVYPVSLSETDRLNHIHIIGATGTGKSTLLSSLMHQDINAGNGFVVIDPHGDLIDTVLSCIPLERKNDVLVIDPSDAKYTVPFNLLRAHSDLEKTILASDLVALFRRFATSWGDAMNSIFANAILAFLESTKGGTLIDLRRFLIEKEYRTRFLESVTDEATRYYWTHEYPLLKSTSIASILTRLDAFLRPKPIRAMVSMQESIDFETLMDTKKIVLVKLSHGLIGAENSYLLGACIVAKVQQAAVARQAKDKAARNNFFLYIDEFHHFITPSLAHLLSGGRKYGLGLVVAHQDMTQVSASDTTVSSAIIANAGTRIVFRLGDTDAKKFAEGFASFGADDIRNLDRGEAIVRIGRAEHDCNLSIVPIPPEAYVNEGSAIIAASSAIYGIPSDSLPHIPKEEPTHTPSFVPPHIPKATEAAKQEPDQTLSQLEKREAVREHRRIQLLIKKLAEERGYRAMVEQPLEGSGRVDVSLANNHMRIAVEVSVTTTPSWELHNIQKCLSAGYDRVIACSPNQASLQELKAVVQDAIPPADVSRISYTHPDDIALHIPFSEHEEKPEEVLMKGYRVKVSYGDVDVHQHTERAKSIARVIQNARKKET